MAKYNLDKYTAADGLGFPLNFRRGNPNPLDNSSVWASLEAAKNYAATDPVAYVGQILTVVDHVNNVVTVYAIQDEAGNLKKVGTSPVGDESTITVAGDGTVSLYGVSGLELTRTDDGGQVTKITYQPLLVDGKLTWVEPSSTTVEGLATEIQSLKTRVDTVESSNNTAIEGINSKIGTVTEGKTVVEMINDAKTEATYDDTALSGRVTTIEGDYLKAADKTAIENKMATDIATAKTEAIETVLGEAVPADFDTLKEIAAWIQSDTTASAELVTRVTNIENDYLKGADNTKLQGEIDALESFVGTLPEGATSTTVIAYIKEVVDGIKIGDYAKAADLTALTTRVKTLEDVGAEKNIINSVDVAQFAVDETRKLTMKPIAIEKITGLSAAIDSKVDKVEGSRLITSDEATKLGKLVLSEDGTVEISGEINASNVKELGTWITTNRDTIPGLLSATDATKIAGIESGAQVNIIESVSINGIDLVAEDKKVNIPLATATSDGALSAVDKAIIDSIATTYATKETVSGVTDRVTGLEEALTWGTL
nr:MAG TPA: hypothetical protein [Caudoviricetes sp.]